MTTTTLSTTSLTVFVGTRTSLGRSQGIYRMAFDTKSGALFDVGLAAATIDPSFIAIHATRPLLFTVVAVPEGRLRSYAIEPRGGLRLLNEVSSYGAGPAYVQIDRTGRWVATANYVSGSAAVYRIGADGRLSDAADTLQHHGRGVDGVRQEGPHAHSVYFSNDNTQLLIADLGIDTVTVWAFDAETGQLTPGKPLRTPAGSGPRHLALGRRRIYVLNELTSTIDVFENGVLFETVSVLPADFDGVSIAAEVVIDREERFLYASNRGADTVAVFRIGGHLEKVADIKVGRTPRNIVLSPDGRFLLVASQDDDTVRTYLVNAETGMLGAAENSAKVPTPICLRFAPSIWKWA